MAEVLQTTPTVVRTAERGLTVGGTRLTLYDIWDCLGGGWSEEETRETFRLTEQQMADHTIDRSPLRKIQHVEKVIPAGIQEHGMLVGFKFFGMDAEKLIRGSKLEITVSQCRESGLNADLTVLGGKGLFSDGDVEIDRLDRQEIQERFLSRGRTDNQRKATEDERHRVPMDATGQGTRDH